MIPVMSARNFLSHKHPDQLWAQPVSLLIRYQEQSRQHMKLTTHFHLVLGQVYHFALCYSVLFFHLIHFFSTVSPFSSFCQASFKFTRSYSVTKLPLLRSYPQLLSCLPHFTDPIYWDNIFF